MVNKTSNFKTKLTGNNSEMSRINCNTLRCLSFPCLDSRLSITNYCLANSWRGAGSHPLRYRRCRNSCQKTRPSVVMSPMIESLRVWPSHSLQCCFKQYHKSPSKQNTGTPGSNYLGTIADLNNLPATAGQRPGPGLMKCT